MNYFNLNNYYSNKGGGYGKHDNANKAIGSQSSGSNYAHHIYNIDMNKDVDDEDDLSQIDISDYEEDLAKYSRKIANTLPVKTTDYGNRSDKATLVKNNHFGIHEYAKKHKNFISKGIAPYRQKKFSGGPIGSGGSNQAFKTTGNFKNIASLYGTAKSHKLLGNSINDFNVYDLKNIPTNAERAFLRRKNKIKKIMAKLK